ncbi:unnamed protein product, partial [marine sediment metagenome]
AFLTVIARLLSVIASEARQSLTKKTLNPKSETLNNIK